MSFKCPGNITHNRTVYNDIKGKCNIDLYTNAASFINALDTDSGFLKTGVLPTKADSSLSGYTGVELQDIIKGMLCKIAACNTAFESTDNPSILDKLKSWMGSILNKQHAEGGK